MIEATLIGVDRKTRVLNLSVKAKENREEREAVQAVNRAEGHASPTLGDLLKEQMDKDEE